MAENFLKKRRLILLCMNMAMTMMICLSYHPVKASDEDIQQAVVTHIDVNSDIQKNTPNNGQKNKVQSLFLNKNKTALQTSDAGDNALNVSLTLMLILLIIFSLAWFMKKMGYSQTSNQGQLKMLATLNLGQKEKIALIQVGEKQLLVGITSTHINTLHVLEEAIEPSSINETEPKANFSRLLADKLKRQ